MLELDPEEVETETPAARAATSSDGVVSVTPKTGSPFELAANRILPPWVGAGRRHGVSRDGTRSSHTSAIWFRVPRRPRLAPAAR